MKNQNLKNIILITITMIVISALIFIAGIFVANTEWFNDTFYIKSRQMQNLEIKSLKQYTDTCKHADSQYDINQISTARYEDYHKYYLKVVERIKNIDLDELEKSEIINYINGYDKRKEQMVQILFPRINQGVQEGGYGTMINSLYSSAMLEYDRNELITYRFILQNMYFFNYVDIDAIFDMN